MLTVDESWNSRCRFAGVGSVSMVFSVLWNSCDFGSYFTLARLKREKCFQLAEISTTLAMQASCLLIVRTPALSSTLKPSQRVWNLSLFISPKSARAQTLAFLDRYLFPSGLNLLNKVFENRCFHKHTQSGMTVDFNSDMPFIHFYSILPNLNAHQLANSLDLALRHHIH